MKFQQEVNLMTERALAEFEKVPFQNRTHQARLNAVGNIYFLFSNGLLKYIGQRQASGIKPRLDQHFFGKSYSVDENNVQNGTISKWDKIKNELDRGNEITFKTILIEPDNLRLTIEQELIFRFKPEWNIQGK